MICMGVNKVLRRDGTPLMDISGITVSPETLDKGIIAVDATGEFIVGTREVGSSDAEYTRVGYIRFTGKQTVDTGIICNQDTRIRIVFTREKGEANYLFGVSSTNNTASVTAYLSSGGAWRFGNKSASTTLTTSEDLVHTAIVDKTGILRAGTTQSFSGVSTFETIGTLTIGSCRNSNGTLGSPQFEGKIWAIEMWQGDVPTAQFVPHIRRDGTYGFLNVVTQDFHMSITDTPLEGGNL